MNSGKRCRLQAFRYVIVRSDDFFQWPDALQAGLVMASLLLLQWQITRCPANGHGYGESDRLPSDLRRRNSAHPRTAKDSRSGCRTSVTVKNERQVITASTANASMAS